MPRKKIKKTKFLPGDIVIYIRNINFGKYDITDPYYVKKGDKLKVCATGWGIYVYKGQLLTETLDGSMHYMVNDYEIIRAYTEIKFI